MKPVASAFLAVSLMLGGMVVPAEATGRNYTHYGYQVHYYHHPKHSHFVRGFVVGTGTALVVKTLYTPRVVYTAPAVYEPVSYHTPVCRDVLVPGRWELRTQTQNGFTSYYQVWVAGHSQRQCY
jgi:hypothetical protein